MNTKNPHIGSDFDDFLEEEGILAETEAAAAKRILAFQVEQAMQEKKISKSALATRMHTSRPVLDRVLDPANTSITLATMEKVAVALGKRLKIELA